MVARCSEGPGHRLGIFVGGEHAIQILELKANYRGVGRGVSRGVSRGVGRGVGRGVNRGVSVGRGVDRDVNSRGVGMGCLLGRQQSGCR